MDKINYANDDVLKSAKKIAELRKTFNAEKYGYTDEELVMISNFLDNLALLDIEIFLESRAALIRR